MPFEYTSPTPDSLDCPICRQPLQEPVLPPECMHVFCSTCLARSLSHSPTCPIDRRPIQLSNIRPAPRLIHALLDDLPVDCTDCEWTGRREDYDKHHCSPNPQDESEVPAQTCEYCQVELDASLASHLLSCKEVPTPCLHAAHGCPARLKRDDLPTHLETCAYNGLQGLFSRLEDRFVCLEEENSFLRAKVDSIQLELDKTREARAELEVSVGSRMDRMEQTMNEVLQAVSTLEIKTEMQTMSESMRLQEELQAVKAGLQ